MKKIPRRTSWQVRPSPPPALPTGQPRRIWPVMLSFLWLREFDDASLSLHLGPYVATAELHDGTAKIRSTLLTAGWPHWEASWRYRARRVL